MASTLKQRKQGQTRPEVSTRIHEIALAQGPGAKLPTLRELCIRLDTSPATVGHALGDLEKRNIIYRRQGSGIYVSPKLHQRVIRVLFHSSFISRPSPSPFWGLLWGSFARESQARAARKNEQCQIQAVMGTPSSEQPFPDDLMQLLDGGRTHGILAVGLDELALPWIVSRKIPMVVYAGVGDWRVTNSWEAEMRLGVQALADHGCRRIARWGQPEDESERGASSGDDIDRKINRLMSEQLARRGSQLDEEISIGGSLYAAGRIRNSSALSYQDHGYRLARLAFSRPREEWPDGIVIGDDMVADGAIAAMRKMGIAVGEDVIIVIHANAGSPVLYDIRDRIVRIQYDPNDIVDNMFAMLDLLMDGRKPDSTDTVICPSVIPMGAEGSPDDRLRKMDGAEPR
jgi:DNA-binding LacI/PurR family transcriptional regulator